MTRDRALGWLALTGGLALALLVQTRAPVGVPLYDGVVVPDPYRYLHPTGNQPGDPSSFDTTKAVSGNVSPLFAAATSESPPQAQLIAQQDAFQLPSGTTSLKVSIDPVDATTQPTEGSIAGNVYRISVTDQDGTALMPKSCATCRSLVLRAPDNVTEGAIAYLQGESWTKVTTIHAGTVGIFQANADALGDYAVISGVESPGGDGAERGLLGDPLVFGGIALALFFAAVAVLFWYRRRPPPVPVARLGPGRGRVPSKRKGPRRPPSGRSGS
jgi:hypothetical protein